MDKAAPYSEALKAAEPSGVPHAPDLAESGESPPARKRSGGPKRLVIGAVVLVVLAGGAWLGREWWTVWRFVESTDDAYVKADIVTYSAQVSGSITEVGVADNTATKTADLLLRIDDTRYRAALDEAKARVAAARAAIESTNQHLALQAHNIAAAEAALASATAKLGLARTNATRSRELLARGVTPQAATDQQTLAVDVAEAGLRGAKAALSIAEGQVPVLRAQRDQQEAALNQAKAALALAQKNVDDTVIRASRDGVVGNRGVDVGEFIAAGTKLISLVPLDDVYVVANFKETQVKHFRPGMKANVTSDMLAGAHVEGVIDSIAPATGSEFALIPTENATGNFTKIVQRIPVRIRITPPATANGPRLRPGTSVVVEVDTRGAE